MGPRSKINLSPFPLDLLDEMVVLYRRALSEARGGAA